MAALPRPEPPTSPEPAAGEPDEIAAAADDQGRIGYGRYGRYTPMALAILLLVGLGAIGYAQWDRRGSEPAVPTSSLIGKPAPDVTLTLLDGAPLRLAELRGSVVVLNFWASWCVPCREEAPLFQALSDEAARTGEKTVVVGVGIRTDQDANARAFVQELGLTYPIGRDTATDQPGVGPIERAFGVPGAYPSTVFIRPDGVVDQFHLGPLTADQLRQAVDAARTAAGG